MHFSQIISAKKKYAFQHWAFCTILIFFYPLFFTEKKTEKHISPSFILIGNIIAYPSFSRNPRTGRVHPAATDEGCASTRCGSRDVRDPADC